MGLGRGLPYALAGSPWASQKGAGSRHLANTIVKLAGPGPSMLTANRCRGPEMSIFFPNGLEVCQTAGPEES